MDEQIPKIIQSILASVLMKIVIYVYFECINQDSEWLVPQVMHIFKNRFSVLNER